MFIKEQKFSQLIKKYMRFFLLPLTLLSFALVIACSDQGCIEADDFGEYDTQVLEIPSNSSLDSCEYNAAKELGDAEQGSGVKACFTQGNVTIYDENGNSQVSSSGCIGFEDAKFRNLCAGQCVANCNSNIGMPNIPAEPNWIPTTKKQDGKNSGVTIKPNSLVYIRAIGTVMLGDKFTYPNFYVSADQFIPQSKKANWSFQALDIRKGKSINLSFSGRFNDRSTANNGAEEIGQVGIGSSENIDYRAYNAARRLVAYIIPHPPGYDFDNSKSSEKLATKGVPLLPDANLWTCNYNSAANLYDAACFNKSYRENGYPDADDISVNSVFPVSAERKTSTLATYGGMIRWQDDGLSSTNYDPFAENNIGCDSGSCKAGSLAISDAKSVGAAAMIIGDNSNSAIAITAPFSAEFSFRQLLSSSSCDGNINIEVQDAKSTPLYSATIAVNNGNWSDGLVNSPKFSIEEGQKLVIKQDSNREYKPTGLTNTVSCGMALGVRFLKYHDITILNSGLVSFAMLNGAPNSSSCILRGRIVNPYGSHVDNVALPAGFYEYENFLSNAIDPFRNLEVKALPGIAATWYNEANDNNLTKIFVRKGQVIRFSPESWSAKWMSAGGERECGVGMAMRIEPRPAFLCRGYASDKVFSSCQPKLDNNGKFIGCDENAAQCSDNNDQNNYCPFIDCMQSVNCTDGNENNNFTRTACTLGALSSNCKETGTNLARCKNCSNLRIANAQESLLKTVPNMVRCYNLEDYKGRVENIPSTGFTDADLKDASKAKGAIKLGEFNGEYGNISSFSKTGNFDKDTGNVILQSNQPLNIGKTGRLTFMILDGSDFLKISDNYANNTVAGSSYNGVNGFKIDLSSMLEFNNGEWLEAKLCYENKDIDCKTITLSNISGSSKEKAILLSQPPADPIQPAIVELDEPVGNNFAAQSTTTFAFDPYGSLIRIRNPAAQGECDNVMVGDNYYCHTAPSTLYDSDKIRITFKIKDPEPYDCTIPTANTDPEASAAKNGITVVNTKAPPINCKTNGSSILNGTSEIGSDGGVVCKLNAGAGKFCLPSDDFVDPNDASKNTICTKQFRCLNRYANNTGKYYVTIRVKNSTSNISNIVTDVISPVVEVMDGSKDGTKIGQAERIYKLIIGDPRYQAILAMSLILMYSFYGLGYLLGITEANIPDLIQKVLKISLIYLFVGPEGWDWFDKIVVKFFKNSTDYLAFLMASSFDESPSIKNALNNFDFYDKSILFSSVDKVFGMFFSATVQKKVSALLFASIFGWAYLLMIYYGIILYVYAVGNAILLYLTSQVFISILFVLGPLFLIFTLFNQTKEMFDKWLQQLIGFSLQQIFLLTTLSFFNMMMYEVIKLALGYKICWDDVWTINIIFRITLLSFWTIASLPPRTTSQTDAGDIGNPDGIPSFFSILFIWVVASLMYKFVTFMTDLASAISGGLKASELGSGLKGTINAVQEKIGKPISKSWEKIGGGRAIKELDKALFNSGEIADKDRKAKKQAYSTDKKNRNALESAANKAISDYKKKNGADMAKMTKEEQVQKLQQVKDAAIKEKGEKLSLSEADIKRLKDDKGLKYTGENVFGAGFQATKQALQGNLSSSINDKEVNTALSASEAKAALRNTTKQGRQEMIDAVKKGDLQVASSGWNAVKSSGKSIKKKLTRPFKEMGKALKLDKISPSDEYDNAAQQLVDEGEISAMANGSNWARNDEEKRKIRERVKKNQKDAKANVVPMSNTSTIAKLEMASEEIESAEENKDNEYTRKDGLASAVLGKSKSISGYKDRQKRYKEKKREIRGSRGQDVADNINRKKSEVEGELQAVSGKIAEIDANLNRINDADFKRQNEDLSRSQQTLMDALSSEEDKNNARRRINEIKSDPAYNRKTNQKKEAQAQKNQLSSRRDNLDQQFNKLQTASNAIKAAQKIRDRASEIAENSPELLEGDGKVEYYAAKEAIKDYDQMLGNGFDGGEFSVGRINNYAINYKRFNPNTEES